MSPTTPLHHAFVNVSKAFEDEIVLPSGVKFYFDASYNKNDNATVVGTIGKLPINPPRHQKRILSKLEEGDEVCFSFRVCSSIERTVRDGVFTEFTHPDDKHLKRWTNAKNEWITKVSMPTSTGFIQWTGVYCNHLGEVISGEIGNESKVDRWLSQFSFINEDTYKFKNLIGVDGKDYWKVGLEEIFAKKTPEGIVPVGDRLLLKPIDIDVKHRLEIVKGIHIHGAQVMARYFDRAVIMHDFEPLSLLKGEVVSFYETFVEKYKFWGEDYWLIKPSRVLGKWSGIPSVKSIIQ